MLRRALGCLVLAVAWAPVAHAQGLPTDAEVALGVRQAEDGDYDAAILTLDAAARRLAADPSHPRDLPQAYLYLGIAYLGKGREAAARAKFREALMQMKDLDLNAERFPPKVIDMLEAAREEIRRDSASTRAVTVQKPDKKGGGGKTALLLGGIAAVGGVAVAAGAGGGGGDAGSGAGGGAVTATFPNEVVAFGGGRDFVVDVGGSGTLTARVDWQQQGVLLGMYIVSLANPGTVLAEGNQTASQQTSLSLGVTRGSYRVSVTNSTGHGPEVDTRFTLTVIHP